MKIKKRFSVSLESALHYKLKYIAEYELRSLNRQIEYLAKQCVEKFERQKGEIPTEE